ncbi:PGF-CTERM-anchored ABC transporter substrate-binding protein [Natranaeroarchaeum sulfidigenes]|uniref:PGF-CTERM-anchored ABC transporter substrate-binding protein n=1 Tax=Natranaeroarchaeum sulfidigenes TaxID=2784880 RepID=UPI001EE630EF|nr:PGF-CTERM-anchored ABC transporter substrate-binding protein [Natranaeroarchaeum sulfidigenes]
MQLRVSVVVALLVISLVAPAGAIGAPMSQDSTSAEPECTFPITVEDETGTELTLEEQPDRIVTLRPSAAQTLWEIGGKEQVVGVSKHAENLEGTDEIESISEEETTVSTEKVVGLDPDLVLAPGSTDDETVEQLRELGVTVYQFESASSLDDVYSNVETIGKLSGNCEGAEETTDWMDEQLDIVADTIEGEESPDVLYSFFGFTAGQDTFIDELIVAAGGTNVAAEEGIEEYQPLNEETVVDTDPDWIVLNTNSPEIPDGEGYEETTAVQNDQVIVIDINHLNRPGPRVVYAVTEMAEAFHEDSYAEAVDAAESESDEGGDDATQADDDPQQNGVDDQEDGDEQTSDDPADPEDDGSVDDDLAGFGIGVAALALSLVALLGRVGGDR